jgi:SAM-dependent methyltransferase
MPDQKDMKDNWESSFAEQVKAGAFNTAPVESLVRSISYYLRDRRPDNDFSNLRFLEMGCGAGPNLIWLAQKGIRVSGADISPLALDLCRQTFLSHDLENMIDDLVETSVDQTPWPDGHFDGILESCVFQHLDKETRERAFAEVRRLLKPGGLFCGYMLAQGHSVYQQKKESEQADDPGTLILEEGGSRFYLTDIGLSHFFKADEYDRLLEGFSIVDPCLTEYFLPQFEARKRGYDQYKQSMWAVYAVK